MSNMQVQSSTLEENFVFGSPPLLNGFNYNTCRIQEGAITKSSSSQDCFSEGEMSSYCSTTTKFGNNNRPSYSSFPVNKNTSNTSVLDNLNQFYMNGNSRACHVDNGIKILEQAGIKVQQQQKQNELVFKKRKDLRVLKSVLSADRFKKVTMMFGDGDEGGREIVESVHTAMRNSNVGSISCLFCNTDSQVYENFPIVDGTLFLSPVKLSKQCVRFADKLNGVTTERHMCFICVACLEGKPHKLECSTCLSPWNGSFFQVGTLYSYNILSAIPCCNTKVKCKNCLKPIIDLERGEASTLFFSHFSSRTVCPNCHVEDFHYIKSLETLRKSRF